MNNFSIRDIEMLSGIKAHTLRIWEQRHGFNFCKRKESQHRYYDNDDLRQILRISYLYHHGYKISKIAKLSQEEISNLTPSIPVESDQADAVEALVKFTLVYDEENFTRQLDESFSTLGFEQAVLNVVYPYLENIGMLWMLEQARPAHEHFGSNLIQNKLFSLIEELPAPSGDDRPSTVIFAPEGEVHELPLLVARHILKKNGISTYYMGIDIEMSELVYLCKNRNITHLYFHLITNFQTFDMEQYMKSLQEQLPGIKIVASGPVVNTLRSVPDGVRILSSLEEVLRIKELKDFWN